MTPSRNLGSASGVPHRADFESYHNYHALKMRETAMKVTLRYIIEDVDRYGNVRIYVRQPGKRKVRIRETPGTPAFMQAYQEAIEAGSEVRHFSAEKGSLSALCLAFYQDPVWRRLDKATKEWRRRYLDRVCEARGHLPAKRMMPKHVRQVRDLWAEQPTVANSTLASLKALFAWAVEAGEVDANPTIEVKPIAYHSEGFHTWTVEEVKQYENVHQVGSRARLAMALLLYTAGRREDAVRLGPQHVRNGRIRFVQAKNEHRKPVHVDLPLSRELNDIIVATPTGHLVFLVTEYGKPFSTKGFGNKMRAWCDEAGLPQCSAHGLRKAAATRLAENGATVEEIMAVTGHSTLRQVENYTRDANRAKMADNAFAKLAVRLSHSSPTGKK